MVATSPERSKQDRRPSRPGRQTREKIIDATLRTVTTEGLVGTSARAIARTGEFNQALVFYHFGSIEELLLEALDAAVSRRTRRFGPRLEAAQDLGDLLEVVERLFGARSGADNAAVAAIVSGWPANSEVGCRIVDILRPWEELVESSMQRCLSSTPVAGLLPMDELSYVISSLVFGVEMMRRVDPDDRRAESVLAALKAAADRL